MSEIKGLMLTMIVIFALISIYLGTLLTTTIQTESKIVEMSAKETKILFVLDQIEAVKIGIAYALNFSALQGVYELSKKGGYIDDYYFYLTKRSLQSEEYPIWRNYSRRVFAEYLDLPNPWKPGPPIFEDKIILGVSNFSRNIMNNYLLELKDKFEIIITHTYLGIYSVVDEKRRYLFEIIGNIEYLSDYFSVKDFIATSLDVTSIISRYIELLDFAKSLFINQDVIRNRIENTLELLSNDKCRLPRYLLDSVCEEEYHSYDPYYTIKSLCPNFPNEIEKAIKNSIGEISGNYGNIHLSATVDKYEFLYNYEISSLNYNEDVLCGCKRKEPIYTDIDCDENSVEYCKNLGYYDGECDELTNTIVCYRCLEFNNRVYFTVNLYYKVAMSVLVNVSTDEVYPLYENEKISLTPLTLKFKIITSNDYSYTPIS